VVGAAILRDGRCLVTQRGPDMSMPGKWEFPGGKVEPGERPEVALARELEEELGLRAEIGDCLGRGESIAGARRIVLDVYVAEAELDSLQLREHSRLRWSSEEELLGLDWPEADFPVLAAVRARLAPRLDTHGCIKEPVIISVDWAKNAEKRAVYVSRPSPGRMIQRQEPPPEGWSLDRLLQLALRLRDQHRTAALIGIDAVLGLPTAFARAAGCSDFADAVGWLESSGGLREEAESPAAWRPERPFFRVPAGRGGLSRFYGAAGGHSAMLRQIELRTGAKPVFVLSGIPGTVGSGSRALWRELAPMVGRAGRELRLWPFEGSVAELTSQNSVILAEVYPRAAYGIALASVLPTALQPLAKTKKAAREAALGELEAAGWLRACAAEPRDLEAARRGEDDFDALLTAAALLRLVAEGRPLSCELVDSAVEGGILGTGGVSLPFVPTTFSP
jgi:8-oxo-dGTP diphosphatase